MISDLVLKSMFNDNCFKCHFCNKILKSTAAIRYHIEHRHILKKNCTQEYLWVSDQIQKGRQKKKFGATEWHCTECSKIYTSQQALRAHLKLHYTNKVQLM